MLAGTLLPQTKLKLPTNLELKKINIAGKQTKGKKATKVAQPKSRIRKKICILKLCGTRNSEEMYNIS